MVRYRSRKAAPVYRDCGFESHPLRSTYHKFVVMFKFLKKTKDQPKDIKELIECFGELKKGFESLSLELEKLKKESKFFIQKVGVVRFNPFKDVGGNQSFCIALLNDNDDGFVITSLYNGEGNRIYGKPIKNGKSAYSLSKEEEKAIEKAKNTK